ncbi:MAG TPA: A/G-specific adenine glycosylase [Verrucomicrobiae bacterium]|nr:A/G-specific adenine glycosylase [Verrucomicrobiae bacterium]
MRPVRPSEKSKYHEKKIHRLVALQLVWFAQNSRDLPWRQTRDPYAIWVSEIMLQQTQVKTVIPYWERWMRELPTIESLAGASSEKIHKLWEGLGYYTRVRNMQKAAQFIIAHHAGKFPEKFDDVLALPGIGRYTAGAICSIAFNQPRPIIDGNVIRVLTRVFAIAEDPRDKATNARLWNLAEELVAHVAHPSRLRVRRASRSVLQPGGETPPKLAGGDACATETSACNTNSCSSLNQSLMELGALICTPRSPQCLICPIVKHCCARQLNRVEDFPNLGKRVEITERRFAAFVVEHEGSFLVRQRPADVVNAHLWEFPNVELPQSKTEVIDLAKTVLGFAPKTFESLGTIRHSITRYRITLEAFSVNGIQKPRRLPSGHWLPLTELQKLSFPSAHRKILERIQKTV